MQIMQGSFKYFQVLTHVQTARESPDLNMDFRSLDNGCKHRVASTPELATNFIDYKQKAGMTTVRKSCYYTVLSRRYALRWIYFYLNIFIFEKYTQQ